VHIPEIGYGTVSKRIHETAVKNRIPINVSIEVTPRCNLECVHCYIKESCSNKQTEKELSAKEWYKIIDQVNDQGGLWLLLTGGEPFIRKDFLDIYLYAKRKGMMVAINTNGTLITPEIADVLAEWTPFVVEITLYGRSQKVYEEITGVPSSYAKSMRAVELLMERKIPLNLKTTVLTLNKDELFEIKAFAESLGVKYRFDPILNRRIDGGTQPLAYRLTPEQVVTLDKKDSKREAAWKEVFNRFKGKQLLQPEYIFQCGAGVTMCHIDSTGHLCICMMSRFPNYDLRQGSFAEGWNSFVRKIRETKWSVDNGCQKCDLVLFCNVCPGRALVEAGDLQSPVEYLCKVAHLRAEKLMPSSDFVNN